MFRTHLVLLTITILAAAFPRHGLGQCANGVCTLPQSPTVSRSYVNPRSYTVLAEPVAPTFVLGDVVTSSTAYVEPSPTSYVTYRPAPRTSAVYYPVYRTYRPVGVGYN